MKRLLYSFSLAVLCSTIFSCQKGDDGAQGPAGPQGPQGAQGAQGAAGAAGLLEQQVPQAVPTSFTQVGYL